jgi:transposase
MPNAYPTEVLAPRPLALLARELPEPPRARTGRPAYSNLELVPGILRMLRSGCRWRDLDRPRSPSGVTHWRRLRYWHRTKGYRQVWRTLLNLLVQSKRLDRSLVSLDGTLIPSQEFTEQPGYSGQHLQSARSGRYSLIAPKLRWPSAWHQAITTTVRWES